MASFEPEEYEIARDAPDQEHQRVDQGPTLRQRLGPFTIVCLVLNRTIGSGIFVTPVKVLNGTGSIGVALIFWTLGGFVAMCGLLVWLELGLSIPFRRVQVLPGVFEMKSVSRSGGEKNYLEFIFGRPKFLATCIFGIAFIVLGNLSGNAMAFGSYVMAAAGQLPEDGMDAPQGKIIGIAIGGLTGAILLHVCSRRGGIIMNNFFAITKVLLVLSMILMGLLQGWGVKIGSGTSATAAENLTPPGSMKTHPKHYGNVSDYTNSLLYIIYSYVGFEQPFYVLSEVKRPRKIFPKWTIIAVFIATVLYVLMNVAYFCVVPKMKDTEGPYLIAPDMATVFFQHLFDDEIAKRVMAAMIAFSIFGNIVVMTFTAARVKQEIAKEGILPFSLFFATGRTTWFAWLSNRFFPTADGDEHLEKTPMAALGLHWISSIILIGATAKLPPDDAYTVLVSLYCYAIILLNGFVVSGGLLLLKLTPSRNWAALASIQFWLNPLHAVVYFLTCGFLLFAAFKQPVYDFSPELSYWIIPALGLSVLTWGTLWWLGLHLVMMKRMKELVVNRFTLVVPDPNCPGEYLQDSEVIRHEWHVKMPDGGSSMDGYAMS